MKITLFLIVICATIGLVNAFNPIAFDPNMFGSNSDFFKFNKLSYDFVHYGTEPKIKDNFITLVYDFDTLNSVNKIGILTHSSTIISNPENFESFVSYVIHNYAPNNTNVFVRLSSPGGSVTLYSRLYTEVLRLKTHGFSSTAFIDDMCASGCYMVACAFKKIVTTKTAQLGSIGVVMEHWNFKDHFDILGIKHKILKTSRSKGFSNINGDGNLTEQYEIGKEHLNSALKMFLDIVSNRKNIDLEVAQTAKVWYGDEAMKLGFADEIGNMGDILLQQYKCGTTSIYYVITNVVTPQLTMPEFF
jgi:hypothetical protein